MNNFSFALKKSLSYVTEQFHDSVIWFELILILQLLVSAMGPPGGGRNDITSRFTRHLNMISIDEFDDTTLTRIFTNITDWHFGKGFEGSFVRNGKVLFEITMKITDKKICFSGS